MIPDRIDVAHRPTIVDTKSRLGDRELDCIIGVKYSGTITAWWSERPNSPF